MIFSFAAIAAYVGSAFGSTAAAGTAATAAGTAAGTTALGTAGTAAINSAIPAAMGASSAPVAAGAATGAGIGGLGTAGTAAGTSALGSGLVSAAPAAGYAGMAPVASGAANAGIMGTVSDLAANSAKMYGKVPGAIEGAYNSPPGFMNTLEGAAKGYMGQNSSAGLNGMMDTLGMGDGGASAGSGAMDYAQYMKMMGGGGGGGDTSQNMKLGDPSTGNAYQDMQNMQGVRGSSGYTGGSGGIKGLLGSAMGGSGASGVLGLFSSNKDPLPQMPTGNVAGENMQKGLQGYVDASQVGNDQENENQAFMAYIQNMMNGGGM